MTLTQSWVGYLSRSYEQIKANCLKRLQVTNPEITDFSESNILIILLSFLAGMVEMLNLYIDNAARETFLGTARKFDSMVKLANLMDYAPKAKNAASVSITFTLSAAHNLDLTIPAGTILSNGQGVYFVVVYDTIIAAGLKKAYGNALQYIQSSTYTIGTSDGTPLQVFQLSDNYAHASLSVSIASVVWKEFTSFGLINNITKGFVVSVKEDGKVYLTFGDGVNGVIPTINEDIVLTSWETFGKSGNLPPNSITIINSNLSTIIPSSISLTITNEDYATGGADSEGSEEIRNKAPRALRTLETAKTYQDYIDLPLLVPGVKDSIPKFCCGKYIDLYIVPTGRGTANTLLLNAVRAYMEKRKMITTFLHYYAAGISKIWVKGKIYLKPLVKAIDGQLQVAKALDEAYGYDATTINREVDISEIITTIKSLSLVDRFDLEAIRIKPFARPIDETTNPLIITINTLPITTIQTKYTIAWNIDRFDIYINDIFSITKMPGETYADSTLSFTLSAGTYTNQDTWELTAFPSYPEIFPTTVIAINDLSEPVIEVELYVDEFTERPIYGDLEIIETSVNPLSLPLC